MVLGKEEKTALAAGGLWKVSIALLLQLLNLFCFANHNSRSFHLSTVDAGARPSTTTRMRPGFAIGLPDSSTHQVVRFSHHHFG
jgi:hypothetical protein